MSLNDEYMWCPSSDSATAVNFEKNGEKTQQQRLIRIDERKRVDVDLN